MISGEDETVDTPQQLDEMARMGVAMLKRSLKSLTDRDVDLANDVWDSDDEVDALYAKIGRAHV